MNKQTYINIYKNRSELEIKTAEKIIEVINESLKERAFCCLVLSGGETPKNTYHLLGQDEVKKNTDWSRVHIFFSDERMVPPDNSKSNYGMAEREWLSHIPIAQENVHRMKGEIDPIAASDEYELEMKKVFGIKPVVFDLVILGLGEDGHTASLFPGSDTINEKRLYTRAVYVQQINCWRLTLTLPVINAARNVIFMAAGKQKSSIVERVLDMKTSDQKIPASLVRPRNGKLYWMIDEEAGSLLKEKSFAIVDRI